MTFVCERGHARLNVSLEPPSGRLLPAVCQGEHASEYVSPPRGQRRPKKDSTAITTTTKPTM